MGERRREREAIPGWPPSRARRGRRSMMGGVSASLGPGVLLGADWLHQHPWLALLLAAFPLAGAYWLATWSAFRAAARGPSERWRILSPLAFEPLAGGGRTARA